MVETVKKEDQENLLQMFGENCQKKQELLLFQGDRCKMSSVLEYITKNQIEVQRVERTEPSLEALFMEVSEK